MKVAMVSEHASPLAALGGVDAGGQNVHVAELAREMGRRGGEVAVYTRRDSPDLPKRVQLAPRVTVEYVDAGPPEPVSKDALLPYMDTFAEELKESWAEWRPDVVHAHFWMSGRAALAAGRPLKLPVAQTFHALGIVKKRHQGDKDTSPPERIPEEARIAREADRIVATCSDEVFELLRLGASRRRISVVPCGVDLSLFHPGGPVEKRTEGGMLHRIVVVSRLVERKGVGNVVSALANLPDVELIVAGGPPAKDLENDPEARRLRALTRSLRVEDRVKLRGRVDHTELPALLRSADAVVCVPWYEPFGIVPLEAMACGVPVIVSATGGLVDSVVDGVTGLHVPPRRPDKLAAALRSLLDDPDRLRSLGEAGVRRTRSRYGWTQVARSTMEIYGELLREKTTARAPRRGGQVQKITDSAANGTHIPTGREHLGALADAIETLNAEVEKIEVWGRHLARVLLGGGRLLAAGNGGSAAQAQHLTGELVGRYLNERPAFSALALHAEGSSLTAITNDYGPDEAFARQVRAHGRPGDILLALSTSGQSPNVLAAAHAARKCGMTVWALTGRSPNPLADHCDDAVCVQAESTATVQEAHLVVVHLLCAAVDCAVGTSSPLSGTMPKRLPEEASR